MKTKLMFLGFYSIDWEI